MNFLKLLRTFSKLIFAWAFIILLVLGGFPNTGNALDWNDKEWMGFGCPKSILGPWLSQDQGERFTIETNQIISSFMEGDETFFSYKGNPNASNKRFIEIIMDQIGHSAENLIYLKIRPHLVFAHQDQTFSDCLIKVFRFGSQQDAKLDKYMSWKIYKRIN